MDKSAKLSNEFEALVITAEQRKLRIGLEVGNIGRIPGGGERRPLTGLVVYRTDGGVQMRQNVLRENLDAAAFTLRTRIA